MTAAALMVLATYVIIGLQGGPRLHLGRPGRERVEVSFFESLRAGLPVTAPTLLVAWIWI